MTSPNAESTPSKRPPRDLAVDALRAVAIVAVVLNHSILAAVMRIAPFAGAVRWKLVSIGIVPFGVWVPPSIYHDLALNVVYTFHVPLFAFLAGYVTRTESALRPGFLRDRFVRLMVPYFAWLTIALALVCRSWKAFRILFTHGIYDMHTSGSLWFLYALFVCFVLFRLSLAASRDARFLLATAAFMVLVGAFPGLAPVRFGSDVVRLYPLLVLGHLLARSPRAQELLRRPTVWVPAGVAYAGLLALAWPPIAPSENALFTSGIPVLGAILAALARFGATASAIVFLWGAVRLLSGRAQALLAKLGSRTLGVYAAHSLLLGPLVLSGLPGTLPTPLAVVLLATGALTGGFAIALLAEKAAPTRLLLLGLPARKR